MLVERGVVAPRENHSDNLLQPSPTKDFGRIITYWKEFTIRMVAHILGIMWEIKKKYEITHWQFTCKHKQKYFNYI